MEYYTTYTIEEVQVALAYALGAGLGLGFLITIIKFLVFEPTERSING